MIKHVKSLVFFLVFVLLVNCSFDNKTGIWTETQDRKKRTAELQKKQKTKVDVVKIYSSKDFFSEEIPPVKKVSLSKPKKNLTWKMHGLNLQNFFGNIYLSGISNNFLSERIGKNKFSISQSNASPLVFNNNIFFADDTGTLFSINQKGNVNWKRNIYTKLNKRIFKNLSISIYRDKIFVVDNFGFIYAISLENGKLVWIKNHGIPLKSNLKIFEEKIFVINQDNRLLCFDTESGSKIWDIRSVSSFIKTQNLLALAVSREGDLVTLNSSGDLSKIKADTGMMLWSLNPTGSTFAHDTDFFKSSDIVIDNNGIFFSTASSIFSFNLTTGYLNWTKNLGSNNTPIIDGNNIFLITDKGYFVNMDKNTGEIIWSTNILKILKQKKQKTEITGFIMGSGKIYAVSLNGYLIVCSATSGKAEYFKKVGGKITAPPIISNGVLYILTSNSEILGYR